MLLGDRPLVEGIAAILGDLAIASRQRGVLEHLPGRGAACRRARYVSGGVRMNCQLAFAAFPVAGNDFG